MSTPFGRYVLDERLGAGGMAEVFRARLVGDGFEKSVCIKRILPNLSGSKGFADMLRDEAAIAARLRHPNIVQTLDFGDVDGTLFIAMEMVEGTTLGHLLGWHARQHRRLAVACALHVASSICRGLHHAHTASVDGRPLDIVHRDVTPQNILLAREGDVKVADFGVARANERLTRTAPGVVKGKVGYMAPEQVVGGACDHRLDQFATGVVLWEMLTGRRLFREESDLLTMERITRGDVHRPSTLRPDLPPELDEVVLRALALRPAERFPDLRALDDALGNVLFTVAKSPADYDLRDLVAASLGGVEPTLPMRASPTPAQRGGLDSPTLEDVRTESTASTASGLVPAGAPELATSAPVATISAVGLVSVRDPDKDRRGPASPRPLRTLVSSPSPMLRPPLSPTLPEVMGVIPAAPGRRRAALVAAMLAGVLVGSAVLYAFADAADGLDHNRRLMREAKAAFDRGEMPSALALLREVESRAPAAPEVQRNLGSVLARMGEKESAYRAYQRYIALSPDAADADDVREILAEYEASRTAR